VNIVDLATVAGSVAAVVAVILTLVDRRRDRRRRESEAPPPASAAPPVPVAQPQQPILEAAPDAWGQPVPAIDTREAANDFLSILAYVLGLLGAVPLLLSRRRTVRYHALQSIGIDVLTLGYLVAGTVVGVTWSFIRYGSDPMPNNDPVLNAFVGGIFVVELLPRFYCVLQVLRNRPARVPGVWRMAATLAARRRPPPPPPPPGAWGQRPPP
jgi:uncharacterized membrane protein